MADAGVAGSADSVFSTFDELFLAATGCEPYPYQRRIGEAGLPELVEIPTGLGKTAAVTMSWLYRRRFHKDSAVRVATPRRLVFVLPMRVLVEQTQESIRSWLDQLGLAGSVPVHVLMGGEPMNRANDWRRDIDGDSIVIGTMDMILSRCLNRGYGESRYLWPIDFGLLNSDCHFVFDEVQLMGPGLATSRQLHGLREVLGTAQRCGSTWMSATVDHDLLSTIDAGVIGSCVVLEEPDLASSRVTQRFRAPKELLELPIGASGSPEHAIAVAAVSAHRGGTLTLVISNTVERATTVFKEIERLSPDAEVVLLHSRFRPIDRFRVAQAATGPVNPDGVGRIVVSTQVIEAGVDISATTLITEVAPWPSLVQRAGRCNRDGLATLPTLMWVRLPPQRSAPYELVDLEASTDALAMLSNTVVDSQTLGAVTVPVGEEIRPVLRRRDLLDLFDTLPDLTGNDVDVSRFIRQADDLDVAVAWRDVSVDGFEQQTMPGRLERCAVPVSRFRSWLKGVPSDSVRKWDPLMSAWVRCRIEDVRPGIVALVDRSVGGYSPTLGWSPESSSLVDPVVDEPGAEDQATADDPISVGASWVTLTDHLADTLGHATSMIETLQPNGLTVDQCAAALHAARLHDIGKAHDVFRASLNRLAKGANCELPDETVFAKSGTVGALRHGRPNFRHELASALCLLGEGGVALNGLNEHDLIIYLVAAHHGRVRMGVRSLPGDLGDSDRILGIESGDKLPRLEVPNGEIPACSLDVTPLTLGGGSNGPSWSDRAIRLRDRTDLGPFRLGFLEAVVRLSDWRASESPTAFIPDTHILGGDRE